MKKFHNNFYIRTSMSERMSLIGVRRMRRNHRRRNVIVYPFIMIVDCHRQHFLGILLSDDVLVKIFEYLFGRRRRLSEESVLALAVFFEALLRIDLAQHDEEVMTLIALDKTRRADERLYMGARISAFRTAQG